MTKTTSVKRRMRKVVLESPYSISNGRSIEDNVAYAKACAIDYLNRFEAPIASHLLWTQPGLLDDSSIAERTLGMEAGFAWTPSANLVAVYQDFGISGGMKHGIERAKEHGVAIEYRNIMRNGIYVPQLSDKLREYKLHGHYRCYNKAVMEVTQILDMYDPHFDFVTKMIIDQDGNPVGDGTRFTLVYDCYGMSGRVRDSFDILSEV